MLAIQAAEPPPDPTAAVAGPRQGQAAQLNSALGCLPGASGVAGAPVASCSHAACVTLGQPRRPSAARSTSRTWSSSTFCRASGVEAPQVGQADRRGLSHGLHVPSEEVVISHGADGSLGVVGRALIARFIVTQPPANCYASSPSTRP